MRISGFILVAASAAIVSCGEQPSDVAVSDAPVGFDFRAADLYRETPNDICRSRDREFAAKLIGRAQAAISPDLSIDLRFEDFQVHDYLDGSAGKEAWLRLRSGEPGQSAMLTAAGPFDPANCEVGEMKVWKGPNAFSTSELTDIVIPRAD